MNKNLRAEHFKIELTKLDEYNYNPYIHYSLNGVLWYSRMLSNDTTLEGFNFESDDPYCGVSINRRVEDCYDVKTFKEFLTKIKTIETLLQIIHEH